MVVEFDVDVPAEGSGGREAIEPEVPVDSLLLAAARSGGSNRDLTIVRAVVFLI